MTKSIEYGNRAIMYWDRIEGNDQWDRKVRYRRMPETSIGRVRLPHGWLVTVWSGANSGGEPGTTFVPFAENGTGWGSGDDVNLRADEV